MKILENGIYRDATAEELEYFSTLREQPSLTQSDYEDAVQEHMNMWAKAKGYGTPRTEPIVSIVSYVASDNPTRAAEAKYAVSLRDQTWDICYNILKEVQEGLRVPPTIEELIAELPVPDWPIA